MATTARKSKPSRSGVSLDRALSKLGLASRKQAGELIAAGRVRVDKRIVRDPSTQVVPERVAITIDGERAERNARVVVMLHKPRGVVTTRSDPDGRPTVYDLLKDVPTHVIPIGRLDLATSGLLLFTNDTRLGDWLTDPRTAIPRVYLVTVRGRVDHIPDERVIVRKASGKESHLVITLTGGKNREIRNLMADYGYSVTSLKRVQFGGLELGDLEPEKWRVVTDEELAVAFPAYKSKRVPSPK